MATMPVMLIYTCFERQRSLCVGCPPTAPTFNLCYPMCLLSLRELHELKHALVTEVVDLRLGELPQSEDRVAGDGGQKQRAHRLAEKVGAADDDRVQARKVAVEILQQHDAAERGAGHEALAPDHQPHHVRDEEGDEAQRADDGDGHGRMPAGAPETVDRASETVERALEILRRSCA